MRRTAIPTHQARHTPCPAQMADSRRRAAARLRSVIKEVGELVDARSTARRHRLFKKLSQGAASAGPLAAEIQLLESRMEAEGRVEDLTWCLHECTR